jgi:hypothetical protein
MIALGRLCIPQSAAAVFHSPCPAASGTPLRRASAAAPPGAAPRAAPRRALCCCSGLGGLAPGHGGRGGGVTAAAMAHPADAAAGDEDAALLASLPDAHAHPQLDAANAAATAALRVPCVAAMGVAANVDWGRVEALAALAGAPPLGAVDPQA